MMHSDLDAELKALVQPGWIRRRLPDLLRSRADARARAMMAVRQAPPSHSATPVAPPVLRSPLPVPRLLWLAGAASFVVAAGTAGAIGAIQVKMARRVEVGWTNGHRPAPVDPEPASSTPPPRRSASAGDASSSHDQPRRRPSQRDRYAAELDLLQHAQHAYAGGDLERALVLLREHDRRFPDGLLAEEREALLVRSLWLRGLQTEAQRRATAFARRFPRSVLLPPTGGASNADL